jgi:hypothetical protein
MKTIDDFEPADIDSLRDKFTYGSNKEGFNLTSYLDKKVENINFDQGLINEIVLWKINRYLTVSQADWLKDFNDLKDIDEIEIEPNKSKIKAILKKMLSTHMIQLPMASTLLRFRNPKNFQIIDERTFRLIFGTNATVRKIYNSSNADKRIDLYFDYLRQLKEKCKNKGIPFFESDRLLYQFDKEENGDFKKKKKI